MVTSYGDDSARSLGEGEIQGRRDSERECERFGAARGDVRDGQGVEGEARQAGGVAPRTRVHCRASAY